MSNQVPFLKPSEAVSLRDGHPITTTLSVSLVFGRQHKDILERVRALDCSPEFRQRNFPPATYHDEQGKPRPMVELTRDGFTFLVMGFTGRLAAQFKEGYIAAFNALEAQAVASAVAAQTPAIAEARALRLELAQARVEVSALQGRVLDLQDYKIARLEADRPKPKRAAHKPLTAAEAQQIRALAAQGLSNADIARRIGRSSASVGFVLRGAQVAGGAA